MLFKGKINEGLSVRQTKRVRMRIGQIASARQLNKKNCTNRFVYAVCEGCGKGRWVRLLRGKPRHRLCKSCVAKIRSTGRHRELNNCWKGGQYYSGGYVFVLKPDHPHARDDGYIKRAWLVLEEKLGRYLLPGSDVHHINGIKDDDRPENVIELSHSEHSRLPKKRRDYESLPLC